MGSTWAISAATREPAVIQCAHCHTPIPDDAKFCFSCGSQVSDAEGQARASQSLDTDSLAHMEKLLREDTAGEFEIHSLLGRGGMAVVYLATEIHLSRKVAIKVLPPELTFGHGVDRFMREAKTAAALDHPNIIPIYRIASGGKIFWYAMKYLEGRSLEDVLRERHSLPLDETLEILSQVADALDYAHEHSVIHRDIKPANIMLDARNRVIVTDFGIAKALTERTLTASGSVVGTPYYMSPEQGMGKGVTGRSDQYSVAVMAYRMLSGQVPFEGDSAIDILHKHVMVPPPPLESIAPLLPPHVCRAIHRALEKKPEARFPTVTALVHALRSPAALDERAVSEAATIAVPASQASLAAARAAQLPTTKRPAHTAPAASAAQPAAPAAGAAPRAKRSRVKTVVLTLSLAAVAGAFAGYYILMQQRAGTAGSQTESGAPAPGMTGGGASEPAAGTSQPQAGQPPTAGEAAAGSAQATGQPTTGAATGTLPAASEPRAAAGGAAPPAAGPGGEAGRSPRAEPGLPVGRGAQPMSSPPSQAARPGAGPPSQPVGRERGLEPPARERGPQPTQPPRPEPRGAEVPRPPAAEPEPTDLPSQPGMGLLMVLGAPPVHRLFVDGRPQLRPRLELPPGSHQIRIVAPNQPPFETTVTVLAGQRTVVRYGQAPAAAASGARSPAAPPAPGGGQAGGPTTAALGILQIRIAPWANVSLNGVALGAKTLVVDTLIPGTHLLRFERQGFVPQDTTITLRAGETVRLLIRMVPQP